MEVAHKVVDRAVQTYGAAGVSDDTVLARLYAITRALQIADGPDEVHLRTVARQELALQDNDRTRRRRRGQRERQQPRRQGGRHHRRIPRHRPRHRQPPTGRPAHTW